MPYTITVDSNGVVHQEYKESEVRKMLRQWEGRQVPPEMIGWFVLARAYVQTERELDEVNFQLLEVQDRHKSLAENALYLQQKLKVLAKQMDKLMIPEVTSDESDDKETRVPAIS
jgi:hypothetical protein